MTINSDNLLESILESLERIEYIKPADIPNIDLYMDQVTTFMDSPVFRRSTMKVPTFSNFPLHLKSFRYLKNLDFTGKFNVLAGHFFIENFFDMLYNNSTT